MYKRDKKKKERNMQGFTLMEMLVTIALIGILASLTIPSLTGARERARDSERVTEVGQIVLGIELFYNTCRSYPVTLATTDTAGGACPGTITLGTFIPDIPKDPFGTDYYYGTAAGSFVVGAKLEVVNSASLANDIDTGVGGVDCTGQIFCKGG